MIGAASGAIEAVITSSAALRSVSDFAGSAFAVFTGFFLIEAVLTVGAPAEALALSWRCVLHPETKTKIARKDTARLTRLY